MASPPPEARSRIDSIDLLRGLVIVLMALDHVRDFFGITAYPPEDLSRASAGLFLTRWVTHFCAPVFVYLAGLGTALMAERRPRSEVSRFLLTRGLWLVVVELVLVNGAWLQFLYNGTFFVQVIWVLGVSMIVLAGLIRMPRWAIAVISLGMIAGHNLLDGIQASSFGALAPLWAFLHQRAWFPLGGGYGFLVNYPLIPWIGVMGIGYLSGGLYRMDRATRARWMTLLGAGMIAAFLGLRALNLYGDPGPWSASERGPIFTLLSVLNTAKYPPSLLFLLMTLGPALLLLPRLEGARGRLAGLFTLFGRVPFFFYVIHIPFIHLVAAGWAMLRYGAAGWWFRGPDAWPAAYEPRLSLVYIAWVLVVLALLPACAWFAGVKSRRRHPLLSYL